MGLRPIGAVDSSWSPVQPYEPSEPRDFKGSFKGDIGPFRHGLGYIGNLDARGTP